MGEQVRVLRILEYVGDRDWVENCLVRSQVPLNGQRGSKGGVIRSAIVGDFPEILGKPVHGHYGVSTEFDERVDTGPVVVDRMHENNDGDCALTGKVEECVYECSKCKIAKDYQAYVRNTVKD